MNDKKRMLLLTMIKTLIGNIVQFFTKKGVYQPIKKIIGNNICVTDETYKSGLITPYDTIKSNQLILDNFVNLSSSTSSVPPYNRTGGYITKWLSIENRVGHKVYARIITSSPKLRLVWYKDSISGYDFVTGEYVTQDSTVPSMNEGIYTITQDMIWSDGYAQLYYYVYNGLQTGNHYITLQLTDLTEIYGAGNEPTNILTLKAQHPELNIPNKYGYRLIGAGEFRTNRIETLPVYDNAGQVDTKNYFTAEVQENVSPFGVALYESYYNTGKKEALFTATTTNEYRFKHNGSAVDIIIDTFNLIANHKYFISYDLNGVNCSVGAGLKIANMFVVDLTDIFGWGREPSTIEELKDVRPDITVYSSGIEPLGTTFNKIVANDGTVIPLSAPLYKVGSETDMCGTNVGVSRLWAKREYQTGDENDEEVFTDGHAETIYKLSSPFVELFNTPYKFGTITSVSDGLKQLSVSVIQDEYVKHIENVNAVHIKGLPIPESGYVGALTQDGTVLGATDYSTSYNTVISPNIVLDFDSQNKFDYRESFFISSRSTNDWDCLNIIVSFYGNRQIIVRMDNWEILKYYNSTITADPSDYLSTAERYRQLIRSALVNVRVYNEGNNMYIIYDIAPVNVYKRNDEHYYSLPIGDNPFTNLKVTYTFTFPDGFGNKRGMYINYMPEHCYIIRGIDKEKFVMHDYNDKLDPVDITGLNLSGIEEAYNYILVKKDSVTKYELLNYIDLGGLYYRYVGQGDDGGYVYAALPFSRPPKPYSDNQVSTYPIYKANSWEGTKIGTINIGRTTDLLLCSFGVKLNEIDVKIALQGYKLIYECSETTEVDISNTTYGVALKELTIDSQKTCIISVDNGGILVVQYKS